MMPRRSLVLLALSLVASLTAPSNRLLAAPAKPAQVLAGPVTVHPTTLDLRHQRQPHSLQVLGTTSDGFSLDLRDQAHFASADPRIATVDERGWVRPVGNGETSVKVEVAGQTLTVAVKVHLPAMEPPISFRHEVMAVLSRASCNAGACHGYSLGKNGFKLSLRGSDPQLDYPAITKETYGRRISPLAPDASLLVVKARGEVPHEGGVRFRKGSLSDDIFVNWVRQGAPGDLGDPARVVGIRLVPDGWCCGPARSTAFS